MPAKHWSTDTYTVRERFGMGEILLATGYCAILFASAQFFGLPWQVPVGFAGMAVWVAVCQVVLRRWGRPRTVSVIAGCIYTFFWMLPSATFWYGTAVFLIWLAFGPGLTGAVLGYMAGVFDASLFLIHDYFGQTFRAKRIEQEALRSSMGEATPESPWDE